MGSMCGGGKTKTWGFLRSLYMEAIAWAIHTELIQGPDWQGGIHATSPPCGLDTAS